MDGRGRRVAVTGLGVVAPCGVGAPAFWDGLLGAGITSGRSVRLADWDPSPWYDTPKEARRADRVEQFATAAAAEAMAAAGEVGVDPARCVAIEDSPTGVRSAVAAGVPTLAVPHVVPVPQTAGAVQVDGLAGMTPQGLADAVGSLVVG